MTKERTKYEPRNDLYTGVYKIINQMERMNKVGFNAEIAVNKEDTSN